MEMLRSSLTPPAEREAAGRRIVDHLLHTGFAAAITHARRSVELYRRADRPDGVASALNSVAWRPAQTDDAAQAVAYGQEALTLHREIGDRDGEAVRKQLADG
jgi:hypothetical protein